MAEKFEGEIGNNKGLIGIFKNQNPYNIDSQEKSQERDGYLEISFTVGSDQARYGKIVEDL